MKSKFLLLATLIAATSAISKKLELSRNKIPEEHKNRLRQTVFDETVIQDSPVNYLYTVAISVGTGTPNQTSTFIVDINYPVTVIWPVTCLYYFNTSQNCTHPPINVGQFYNSSKSPTY